VGDDKNVTSVSEELSVCMFKVRRWTLLGILDLKMETLLSFENIRYYAKSRKIRDFKKTSVVSSASTNRIIRIYTLNEILLWVLRVGPFCETFLVILQLKS